jgi:molybdate transport system ATP-binding protein
VRLEVRLSRRVSPSFALDAAFVLDLSPGRPAAALVGPTGAGKSLLLAALAGAAPEGAGRLALDGEVLFDGAAGIRVPPERRGIGLVPQDGLLFPHLTVEGNLRFAAARSRGRPGPPVARIVEALDLGPLLRRAPATLSGGERQRAAMGRALASAPRLLLLDEPVSALDAAAGARALDLVDAVIREFRLPAILVTHRMDEARARCDAAVRLEEGRVVACGPAEAILGAA